MAQKEVMFVRSRMVCRRVARYGGCLKKLRKKHTIPYLPSKMTKYTLKITKIDDGRSRDIDH